MAWEKISAVRYENSDANQYISYLAETNEHLEFWYLNDGSSDKALSGAATPQELGVPDDVVNSNPEADEAAESDTPGVGHNSGAPASIAADSLRSLVDRIERLDEERKALGSDIKDIFGEAKSAGFDVKVLRALLRLRKLEPAAVEEMETLLDVYKNALGM